MMYNADKLMSAFFFTGMPMHFGFFLLLQVSTNFADDT